MSETFLFNKSIKIMASEKSPKLKIKRCE